MPRTAIDHITAEIAARPPVMRIGRVTRMTGVGIGVAGLGPHASIGDMVELVLPTPCLAEVVSVDAREINVLPEAPPAGLHIGDAVRHLGADRMAPDDSWRGRLLDPFARPLDGQLLLRGIGARAVRGPPPAAAGRRGFGPRLETGLCALNTILPLARGQRIGLFAGSGVGKSTLLGRLAQQVEADVVVIALTGERGREVRHFVDQVLGPAGLARSVVVAATSETSPVQRRRAPFAAMTIAEYFRDLGQHVLFLCDSVTRLAEAHREIAAAAGEPPALRGHPASLSQLIPALCERAGPGGRGQGDITAIFSVLVAGSDMDEPVADILRGTLDGHIVLDRAIAERGRFPAIDVLRSVSRSLPEVATAQENRLISKARALLSVYDRGELMVRSGLYRAGADPALDAAVAAWPALDAFTGQSEKADAAASFAALATFLPEDQGPKPAKG